MPITRKPADIVPRAFALLLSCMEDRIDIALKRNRRRRRIGRVIYLVIIITAAVVGWQFIPQDVIDAVRTTYLNPDAAASVNDPPQSSP